MADILRNSTAHENPTWKVTGATRTDQRKETHLKECVDVLECRALY